MMAGNKKILLIIVILALLAVGAFYFFQKLKYPEITIEPLAKEEEKEEEKEEKKEEEKEEAKTFGEKIYEMIQNPAGKIPQTNPFKAKTNPFEGLKINPFE
ncbi:hypothetical protein KJA13_01090 [Patescibacteria group bacterium]|nr:hypothetical protein [Patescibacteria group bacterium]